MQLQALLYQIRSMDVLGACPAYPFSSATFSALSPGCGAVLGSWSKATVCLCS